MSKTYNTKREEFYKPLRKDFWPELYDEEYSLYDVHLIAESEIQEIRTAAERIDKIYTKFWSHLRTVSDEVLLQLDIPKEVLKFVRLKTLKDPAVIRRVDLIKTITGYVHCEVNWDTPTFIKELFNINGLVCKEFGVDNPNHGLEEKLASSIRNHVNEAFRSINGKGIPKVVFSAHGDSEEDFLTIKYLHEISKIENSEVIPLEDLMVDDEGLYDSRGNKIDVLYRQTYPIEHMIYDIDIVDGIQYNSGLRILNLVKEGKLAIINPPSAFLLQSKAVQAAIWAIYENHNEFPFFTDVERLWVKKYFLPTYLEEDVFLENKEKFVKKPSFGREGDTIEIFDGENNLIEAEKQQNYTESIPVYQKFVELPKTTMQTLSGEKTNHVLMGCFVIDGEGSALGIRAGNQITGNSSAFLPVGVKNIKNNLK